MIIWPVKSASLPKNWELSQSACIFSKGFPPATAGPSGEAGYGQESVMKPLYIIMAAVFAVSSPALANENWQEKDTNGDGQLSRAEHDAGVAAAWTAKDADGNGQLSTAEAGMKAGTHWTAADTDGDGQLSQSEFTAMKAAWFSKADTDGDGSISKAEHDAAKAMKKR